MAALVFCSTAELLVDLNRWASSRIPLATGELSIASRAIWSLVFPLNVLGEYLYQRLSRTSWGFLKLFLPIMLATSEALSMTRGIPEGFTVRSMSRRRG